MSVCCYGMDGPGTASVLSHVQVGLGLLFHGEMAQTWHHRPLAPTWKGNRRLTEQLTTAVRRCNDATYAFVPCSPPLHLQSGAGTGILCRLAPTDAPPQILGSPDKDRTPTVTWWCSGCLVFCSAACNHSTQGRLPTFGLYLPVTIHDTACGERVKRFRCTPANEARVLALPGLFPPQIHKFCPSFGTSLLSSIPPTSVPNCSLTHGSPWTLPD
jgi:hypothetical protein